MCGRFELNNKMYREMNPDFNFSDDFEFERIDIRPTDMILSVDKDLNVSEKKWGMQFTDNLVFNSRIETILEKEFWRELFTHSRVITPMTAFYEWTTNFNNDYRLADSSKIPFRLAPANKETHYLASIIHKDSVSFITTEPNEFMSGYHNRMPVILNKQNALKYLDGNVDDYFDLLKTAREITLKSEPGYDVMNEKIKRHFDGQSQMSLF
ncbi:MAG TPA: SOS response-associated peptidase family protein [Ignavibacteria bacterium]|nr:SOS response-associated peptidase family protein [Ignavibacteria bacterium]